MLFWQKFECYSKFGNNLENEGEGIRASYSSSTYCHRPASHSSAVVDALASGMPSMQLCACLPLPIPRHPHPKRTTAPSLLLISSPAVLPPQAMAAVRHPTVTRALQRSSTLSVWCYSSTSIRWYLWASRFVQHGLELRRAAVLRTGKPPWPPVHVAREPRIISGHVLTSKGADRHGDSLAPFPRRRRASTNQNRAFSDVLCSSVAIKDLGQQLKLF
jgi:hypothetical protein